MNRIVGEKAVVISVILLSVLMIASCGSPAQTEAPPPEPAAEIEELPVFTLETLAEYDGKEGRPAYVAVDWLVYDFTDLGRWSGGTHNGYEAGQDLTEALREVSPHGDRVLSRAPVVGTLED